MTDRRNLSLGVALIAVGVYALLSRRLELRGPAPILLLLGAVFFAISALSRFHGPLLPAGVLLGLGAGLLLRAPLEEWLPHWATILLGLGTGFLLVAGIDRMTGRARQPPPLVPGAVLVGIALAEGTARSLSIEQFWERLESLWPFLILAGGILLVLTALRRRRT